MKNEYQKTSSNVTNYDTMRKSSTTKHSALDMTTRGSSPRQTFRQMIPDLIHKAEQFLKAGALTLPVGTYTARDIHSFLNRSCRNYFQLYKAPSYLFTKSCLIDVNCTHWVVLDHGVYSFPWYNVFYSLWKCEIQAGWSGHKSHKFIVDDKRECISESTITFSGKQQAKKLSSMVRQYNFPKDKPCQLSLTDGCVRCTYSVLWEYDRKHQTKPRKYRTETYDGFVLSPLEFSAPDELSGLCVRFDAHQLRQMYGECKIRIFMNKESDGPVQNPHHIRVTIENPDGWIIASDTIEYKIMHLNCEDIIGMQQEFALNEAYNANPIPAVKQSHQESIEDTKETARTFLPMLWNPSIGEGINQQTSILPSSYVPNHLCVEFEIDQIRKLYGEGKLHIHLYKGSNSPCKNPYNILMLIETASGCIIGNQFLNHKIHIQTSLPHPRKRIAECVKTKTNPLPDTRSLIGPVSSSSAPIQNSISCLTSSTESQNINISSYYKSKREYIEHSVKKLQISMNKVERDA